MLERMGERRGKHGAPPKNCDHHGTIVAKRDGDFRCTRCWRVGRVYPQGLVWHFAQRRQIRARGTI